MAKRFKARKDLDLIVAQMVKDHVTETAREAERIAKREAPPTKTWVSMRDGAVREPHWHADGDELPNNLRFKLTAFAWDLAHPGAVPIEMQRNAGVGNNWGDAPTVPGRYSYLRFPRDKSQGHFVQIVNCRCTLKMDPEGVAKMISVTPATVTGTKVQAKVVAEGKYVVEAERGEVYEYDLIADGEWFMHKAVREMGARARR
jgi:hypothetical protein